MKNYKKKIINTLLDKFESSKSFNGTNTKAQSFSLKLNKEFPEYADDANIALIHTIDECISELAAEGLIIIRKNKHGINDTVILNTDRLDDCYKNVNRVDKKDLNASLSKLLCAYRDGNRILQSFCTCQLERIAANKPVRHFNGSLEEYETVLKALRFILDVPTETYQRDYSMRVFGDSKTFERIRNTVISILFDYGDFPERETVLEDLNIVKNPGHVFFKGSAVISVGGQTIDLSKIDGDIALSSSLLPCVDDINVTGISVVTIENLTTFNSYKPVNELVIYLGGYHNTARRRFIRLLYEKNSNAEYYHYGDIDAGGFYILMHLRAKTGVDFKPINMDINTLKQNKEFTKKLTENDRKRLEKLLGSEFHDIAAYMLENNCKLEQEALDVDTRL